MRWFIKSSEGTYYVGGKGDEAKFQLLRKGCPCFLSKAAADERIAEAELQDCFAEEY